MAKRNRTEPLPYSILTDDIHKGERINEVPDGYLKWLRAERPAWLTTGQLEEAAQILQERAAARREAVQHNPPPRRPLVPLDQIVNLDQIDISEVVESAERFLDSGNKYVACRIRANLVQLARADARWDRLMSLLGTMKVLAPVVGVGGSTERVEAFRQLLEIVRRPKPLLPDKDWLDELTVAVQELKDAWKTERSRTAEPKQSKIDTSDVKHNADYTMVKWCGTEYHFALGVQSTAVKALWEEWKRSGLGLHQGTIRDQIDAERDSFRMDTAFRNHPAFGTMIQRSGNGRYRLTTPGEASPKKKTKSPAESRQKRV